VLEDQQSTGLTLVTNTKVQSRLDNLKPGPELFAAFLDHIYYGKPTSMPEEDIWHVNDYARSAGIGGDGEDCDSSGRTESRIKFREEAFSGDR
jgi:hypothetical protein